MVNTTGTPGNWSASLEGYSQLYTGTDWKIKNRTDEWIDLERPEFGLKLSLTLCFADYTNLNVRIKASSTQNRTEPSLIRDERFPGRFDSKAVRQQLGATIPSQSPDSRGILTLALMQ